MDDKKTLEMDLSELCFAMDDNSDEYSYYLDVETGEILFISDYMEEEEREELGDRVDEDPDRYEPIPRAESHEGYEDMEDFTFPQGSHGSVYLLPFLVCLHSFP